MLCVRWWSNGKFNAESPKQGSKRLNSITKTIHFAHLGLLFIYALIAWIYSFLSPPPPAPSTVHKISSSTYCSVSTQYSIVYARRMRRSTRRIRVDVCVCGCVWGCVCGWVCLCVCGKGCGTCGGCST